MNDPAHILVVDDELELLEAIREYLSLRGFRVSEASSGSEMNEILRRDPADLVLLDLHLPDDNGIELTRKLKAKNNTGIIIVTAYGDSEDRVLGLESGADDYIVKPFNFRELLARVNSLLRRMQSTGFQPDSKSGTNTVQIGNWTFDRHANCLTKVDGTTVTLSTGESDLLVTLLANANQPTSRSKLMRATNYREWGPADRSIDVKIARLRSKIEADPSNPQLIKTVRSIGYILIVPT